MVNCPSHPPLVFCRSSLSWRLPHSQQFLKGGVMSCQGWHRWSKWTNDKQWLGRHAKIVPTKTCQCKLSGQVLPCCGSLPKFCSWSMSMASVELHSYMIIVFFLSEWITILAKAVRRPWILSGLKGYGSWKANISNRQKHNKTENQQSSTKDTRWGIRCVGRQTLRVGLSCFFQETTNLEMITPMSDHHPKYGHKK